MSNWKYKFFAEMNVAHSCECGETYDLVEDYKCDEKELENMSEADLRKLVSGFWEEWFWEQCNGGFERI